MKQNNLNVLPSFNDTKYQLHRQWYARNRVYPLLTPVDYILPMQMIIPKAYGAVATILLRKLEDNSTTDVTSAMNSSGLSRVAFTDYDLLIYTGASALGISPDIGNHQLEIEFATGEFEYTEVFQFNELKNTIKIEYWHNEDFTTPDGHIRYTYPYKSKMYLKTTIGKPQYPNDADVDQRRGRNFFKEQSSSKERKFEIVVTEDLMEAIRAIRQHDSVEITDDLGTVYSVDEFIYGEPEWSPDGDRAALTCKFHTDTVITQNGRAYESLDYSGTLGSCVTPDLSVTAFISNDADSVNQTYTPYNATLKAKLINNDYILHHTGTKTAILMQLVGGVYVHQTSPSQSIIYSTNTNQYYFKFTELGPVTKSLGSYTTATSVSDTYYVMEDQIISPLKIPKTVNVFANTAGVVNVAIIEKGAFTGTVIYEKEYTVAIGNNTLTLDTYLLDFTQEYYIGINAKTADLKTKTTTAENSFSFVSGSPLANSTTVDYGYYLTYADYYRKPYISDVDVPGTTITGKAITGTTVKIYGKYSNGSEEEIASGTATQLSTGITYTPNSEQEVRVVMSSGSCTAFGESDWYII